MKDTKIRWANNTWNVFTGCSKISPGCDACYAEVIAEKFRGTAFPNGFEPTYKPHKLTDPRRWSPSRVFVNSMSDMHHEDFTLEQIDSVYDEMLTTPQHDYLVLTKRPQRMARYFCGAPTEKGSGPFLHDDGWLCRRGLRRVPSHIWIGSTIESDQYTFRADWLRRIPATVRFLSCEPLLGPVPSLNLAGLHWVIAGGESGNNSRNFRPLDLAWARDLQSRCERHGIAFYFKQDSGTRTEQRPDALGRLYEEYPLPHPRSGLDRTVGVYLDAVEETQPQLEVRQ